MARKKTDPKKDNETIEHEIEKIDNELIRYEFTDEELQALGQQLAQDFKKLKRIEDEAKNISKKYKSEIEAIKLSIYDIARWIRERYDMRECSVYCYKDYAARRAYYWRIDQVEQLEELKLDILNLQDSGKLLNKPVKEREIYAHELQRELPLGDDTDGEADSGE